MRICPEYTLRSDELGGTLLSIIASMQSGDVTKTIVLAMVGAVVSFVVSLALKWIARKWSRSR